MMLPERRIVDADIEDVWIWEVDTEFEKVAVFAAMLETVREPAGLVITAEPIVKEVSVGAWIVV